MPEGLKKSGEKEEEGKTEGGNPEVIPPLNFEGGIWESPKAGPKTGLALWGGWVWQTGGPPSTF